MCIYRQAGQYCSSQPSLWACPPARPTSAMIVFPSSSNPAYYHQTGLSDYHSNDSTTREKLTILCLRFQHPASHALVTSFLLGQSTELVLQFLLDSSAIPAVIASVQMNGDQVLNDLFYVGRTWCFSLHRERMKSLHKWNFV